MKQCKKPKEADDDSMFNWANTEAKWGKLGEAVDDLLSDSKEEIDDDDYEDNDDNNNDNDNDGVNGLCIPFQNLTNMAPRKCQCASIKYTKSGYTDLDEAGMKAALFCMAEAKFGATAAMYDYQVKWLKRGGNEEPKPSNIDGHMAQAWYKSCAFQNLSGCKFCIRIIKFLDAPAGKQWCIEVGDQQHNNHELLRKEAACGIELPIIMKYMLKPEHFNMNPGHIVASNCKDNVLVSKKMEAAIKLCAMRIRTKHNLVRSGAASLQEADSFSVLYTVLMQFTRASLSAAGTALNRNTIFVVGGDCIFEP
jgi:hypothetical protein